MELNPDAILFVGDLGEADFRLIKSISKIPFPTAVILGNHDRGRELSGEQLEAQLKILGDRNCSWNLCNWQLPDLSVVGGRPCSSGGGYFLAPQVEAVFGPVTLQQSSDRIVSAAKKAPKSLPLVLLAHSGPTGLGSDSSSPCGRDWKSPSLDWGDKDLALAIDEIRKFRELDLVVFGHMHHQLRRNLGYRKTFLIDLFGTPYLNAACVPRRGKDPFGNLLCHFSWAQFLDGRLKKVSHRWYGSDNALAYEEILFNR